MYQSSAKNRKISGLRERCLRIIYNEKISTFKDLLEKYRPASIHTSNV